LARGIRNFNSVAEKRNLFLGKKNIGVALIPPQIMPVSVTSS